MTQEDRQILLKDLCARGPYGVCYRRFAWDDEREEKCISAKIYSISPDGYVRNYHEDESDYIDNVRPYLFPLSSLTEEQRNYISKLLIDTQNEFPPYGELNAKGCDNLFVCSVKQANVLINYCLANHLDINGLIEKGLAIDATGLNVY